jgi:hypothetical protein
MPMGAIYSAMYVSYGLVLGFRLAGKQRTEKALFALALAMNGMTLIVMLITSGHLPVFNIFESFLLAAFILGALGLSRLGNDHHRNTVRAWAWVEILLLFSIILFYPKEVSPERYNHSDLFVILFHGFRIAALAVMLFASAHYLAFLGTSASSGKDILHQARNYLLLGAILFLLSEYTGILWCLSGWGDFWRWNYGFLSSTFILLYLMLVFHLPGKSLFPLRLMAVIGLMSSVVMMAIMVSRSVI